MHPLIWFQVFFTLLYLFTSLHSVTSNIVCVFGTCADDDDDDDFLSSYN